LFWNEKNISAKKAVEKIIYNPEKIKISFKIKQNPKDFDQIKNPALPEKGQARLGQNGLNMVDNSVLDDKQKFASSYSAARQGFEPRYLGPKPSVLPLDDLAIVDILHFFIYYVNIIFSQLLLQLF
tara:strand:- start:325 stop:702 length:378 start_codon:yes stop_codon:yes gene_type:complete